MSPGRHWWTESWGQMMSEVPESPCCWEFWVSVIPRTCTRLFQASEKPGIYRGLRGWVSLLSTARHWDPRERKIVLGWNQYTLVLVTSHTVGLGSLSASHGTQGNCWADLILSQVPGHLTCEAWWSYFKKYTENSFFKEPYKTTTLERGSLKSLLDRSLPAPLHPQIASRTGTDSAWSSGERTHFFS